jgi:elongation factor G
VIDAIAKAGAIVLEPIVNVAIDAPEKLVGDLTSDLSARRGHVTGTEPRGAGSVTITGQVPLAELNGYQSRLRSLTGGAGSYSMEFSHYAPVPPNVQQQLVSQHKVAREEEQ